MDGLAYGLEELAACADREVKLRQRVYPNRIHTGRMTATFAAAEIRKMQAIAKLLRELEVKPLL